MRDGFFKKTKKIVRDDAYMIKELTWEMSFFEQNHKKKERKREE